MKCLLVDDEPGIREGLAALLRRQGHDVRTAADCDSARAALDGDCRRDFDVVVTDWHLPDGLASSFAASVHCPVIAMSGHPEAIRGLPGLREVLTKPVTPSRLLAVIAAVAAPVTPALPPRALPVDVQGAIDDFLGSLPVTTQVELQDDGTFVSVRADLPAAPKAMMTPRNGEVTWTSRGGCVRAVLRLYRDGRPATGMPVVAAAAPWPAAAEFAVDFHDSQFADAEFLRCLDGASRTAAEGGRVHFLNVPRALRAVATSHGRAHDMPMRDAVGPRLPADLADLWSDP